MLDKSDPRAALYNDTGAPNATEFAAAEYARFYETVPTEAADTMRCWYARGQNFLVVTVEADAGAEFIRAYQPDEYAVVIPDAATAISVTWNGGDPIAIPGYSLVFIPAGASTIRVGRGGRLVLLFTTQADDLCAKCVNNESYKEHRENIPPFQPWPAPRGGFKVRHYSLDVPEEPGRFGRIWRCSTLMISYTPVQNGPRDITKLSPHHHDSFEQGSYVLDGAFMHSIRWPWTADKNMWRADQHERLEAPSLTVIPPPSIHTSYGVTDGVNQLIDIFSPPRMDFSEKSGWVLNADDYPMPD